MGIIGADFDAESIYQELNRFKEISLLVLMAFTVVIVLSGLIFPKKYHILLSAPPITRKDWLNLT